MRLAAVAAVAAVTALAAACLLRPCAALSSSAVSSSSSSSGVIAAAAAAGQEGDNLAHCEPLKLPTCLELQAPLSYNITMYPNLLGHRNQEEAGKGMAPYNPLIKVKCSESIHMFLCTMFAPVCTILQEVLPPCRSLCYSAKEGCESLIQQFGYDWPEDFDCEQFPLAGTPKLCVGDPNQQRGFTKHQLHGHHNQRPGKRGPQRPNDYSMMMNFTCPVQLSVQPELEYRLKIGEDQVIPNCGAPCYHNITFFNTDQVEHIHHWIFGFSLLCLVSCAFTLITFVMDMGRFPYPERPIIYLTLCYLAISIIFLVGRGYGEEIACNPASTNSSMNFLREKTIKQGNLRDWRCTSTAMGLYFFLMAASLWWVILTFSWFLSAGLKWSQEGIDARKQILHGVAWGVPLIQTLVMVFMRKVEGDVLSGVCFVGLWDDKNLLYFVLVPLAVYLALGIIFLLLGFGSLVRIRTLMKHDGAKTDKLERLIMRIGVFALCYTTFSVVLIGCYIYEQRNLPKWTQLWQEEVCRSPQFNRWQTPCRFPDHSIPEVTPPIFAIYVVKYLALLSIGIISGCWFWSRKTIATWKSFFLRIFGVRQPDPAYV